MRMRHPREYKYILFDLDGTLTNPALGITNSVMYALKKFGIEVKVRTDLYKFIGPPLTYSFKEYYGFTDEQTLMALSYYRERFSAGGLFENEIYAGMAELLSELRGSGRHLILATSKPEEFAVKILEHFSILEYFTFVAGNTLNETRPEKRDVIKHIMKNIPSLTPDNAIMVGDRKYDVLGAAEFNLPCIGVLYGYGGRDELESAGAVQLAESVDALRRMLLGE